MTLEPDGFQQIAARLRRRLRENNPRQQNAAFSDTRDISQSDDGSSKAARAQT